MSYTQKFINAVAPGAVKSMKEHGVLASITIAQAILESGWGGSTLAAKHKNIFGIKADSRWNGQKTLMWTAEFYGGKYHRVKSYFRKYNNFEKSIVDHALFLVNNKRYREHGFFNAKDYKGQAAALQRAGYATSPTYAKKLINIIEVYTLYKYDNNTINTNTDSAEKYGIVTASALNVREKPSMEGEKIGLLKHDEKVHIYKNTGTGWYDIYFGEHGGYVAAKYIKEI